MSLVAMILVATAAAVWILAPLTPSRSAFARPVSREHRRSARRPQPIAGQEQARV
jgi:hypothetical protein